MDEPPICPDWWPLILWKLHLPRPGPIPGPGPINLPVAIDDMMASLTIHTMSYMMLDKAAAQELRNMAERALVNTAQNLSKLHEQALERGQDR